MLRSDRNIDNIETRHRRSRRWLIFFSMLIGLSILFLLPDVLVTLNNKDTFIIPAGLYLKAAILASIFLINYYIIIPRTLLQQHRPAKFLLFNTALVAVTLLSLYMTWKQIDPGPKPPIENPSPARPLHIKSAPPLPGPADDRPTPPEMHDGPVIILARDLIIIVLTIGFSASLRFIYYRKEVEITRHEMASLQREMELVQLRNQLNPHFLFNTLNSIYALVDIDRNKAKDAIHTLSRMLRHMLYECKGIVSLRQECEFLSSYINLMKMRLPADYPLTVRLDCETAPNVMIQPLLFINIIENAFKYGSRASAGRHIDIELSADGPTVRCSCRNSYDPDSASLPASGKKSGIGLENLRRRLDLRYPGRHSLDITDTGSEYTVRLSIDTSGSQPEQ